MRFAYRRIRFPSAQEVISPEELTQKINELSGLDMDCSIEEINEFGYKKVIISHPNFSTQVKLNYYPGKLYDYDLNTLRGSYLQQITLKAFADVGVEIGTKEWGNFRPIDDYLPDWVEKKWSDLPETVKNLEELETQLIECFWDTVEKVVDLPEDEQIMELDTRQQKIIDAYYEKYEDNK